MLKIILEQHFLSSHQLRLSKGLEPIHSHKWRLLLYFEPVNKNRKFDNNVFRLLKYHIREITNSFAENFINNHYYFKHVNPSTENIAYFIFMTLENLSPSIGYKPIKVSLWETKDSCASWIRE
jgi:6-pyruvoyltetrahydropterin/6-carboxytetrahydropterin synthase